MQQSTLRPIPLINIFNPNVILWAVLLIIFIWDNSFTASALTVIPDSELTWKNVELNHKKSVVFTIFHDSRGLIWIGSDCGIAFYDGVKAHTVGKEEIGTTHVHSVTEYNNILYLGTNDGLFTLNLKTGKIQTESHISDKEIRTLLLVNDELWIGGLNGLSRYHLSSGEYENITQGLPHKSVYSLLRDSRGIIYAGTYAGLARWNDTKRQFQPLNVTINGLSSPPFLANCILEYPKNESIYVGSEGMLLRYHISSDTWNRIDNIKPCIIKSLAKDNDGRILIGSDEGVLVYEPDAVTKHYRHNSQQNNSLANNEIWCLSYDSQNNILWAGHERGFSIASTCTIARTVKIDALTGSHEGNDIYAIHRDRQKRLWLAGANGLIRLDKQNNVKWYTSNGEAGSISHKHIRAIHEAPDGEMWFATDKGINRYNKAKDAFEIYHFTDSTGHYDSSWVYTIGSSGKLFWSGGFLSGIHLIDTVKLRHGGGRFISDIALNSNIRQSESADLTNDMVNNVVADKSDQIWIILFRDKYVNIYNTVKKTLSKIDIHSVTGEYPVLLTTGHDGRVWCGYNGGVIRFNTNKQPEIIKFPHTIDDNTPLSIGVVGKDIWVTTTNTLWKIDSETLKPQILPIPQKTYTSIYDDQESGNVILGGSDEILVIDKKKFDTKSDFQTIRMALAIEGDTPLRMSDIQKAVNGLTIPYGGDISFLVSTLDYSPNAMHRYMYRLAESPADTLGQWTVLPEGINTITLTNLKMGKYNLYVKTLSSPHNALTIPLYVQPPFWLTWKAFIFYLILITIVILGIVYYMRKRNRHLLIEKERRTMLENAEKKLAFLSNISHDFKTPLSMIIGPVSLMKEKVANPEDRKSLEIVYDNAIRLNNMIHRSLELQHLKNADEDLLILSIFNIVAFCNGIFEIFKESHPQKNFVFHTSTSSVLIEADAVKLESAITNLLSNSCKYSGDKATISLGIDVVDDNVEIIISDDGVGIPDKDQSLVFQRMFRSPDTAKLTEGTGLGLYLSKKYLELMEGNIIHYSRENQGTCFIVTLPISKKIISENNTPASQDPAKPKILIVEDNVQISKFITGLLSKDYTCITAENGRSGLAIAASFCPDLIIADEMMPSMSGLEMIRRLKQNCRLAFIPIIMLTAKSDNKTESDSIKIGVETFMSKPFEPSSLMGRVEQLLKARNDIKEKIRIQTITESQNRPIEAESVNEKLLAKIAKAIEDNIADPNLNVNFLCEKCGISNKQLYRMIKKYMDMTPIDYIRGVRLQKAALLLSQKRFTVAEISYMVGFNTPSYFAKCFQSQFGVKPSQYKPEDVSPG